MDSNEKFLAAIERTLRFEGGYVNDPADPGGETKYGISGRSYPELDIKNLTRGQAVDIYFRDYWEQYGYGQISDASVAGKLFDLCVNTGPSRAHILLQQAVNRIGPVAIETDGILGPQSIRMANGIASPAHLLAELKLGAIGFYTELAVKKNMQKFLVGWIRRALA